ncbi:glycoside hydrolase family 1 protein [Lactococcus nasutitermitis]|uniref:Glycoside hydrolase family 1 protein n=1 Tax=Lactococcus nasutitermitis TaxID=1652957 RepID=A0ABV9JEE8_9LACT|nr:glycoside hydrolase family 1 protein [Lactococcus nasutitermitis]
MVEALKKDFFWGNSSSSMQTEGGWNEGGKGLSVYDVRPETVDSMNWQVTIDNYHDFETDFDLMQAMNMNMYRFQISWSRVCPDGDGAFNEEGIAFYSRMIDALIARGIEPMICLYHFDMPLALAEKYDGFLSRHVVDAFVRYGKEMMRRFAGRVKYWIVFNEHNLYFTSDAWRYAGVLRENLTLSEIYQIFHHTMLAHCQLTDFIHGFDSSVKIGGMLAYTEIYPATTSPQDNLAVRRQEEFSYLNLCDVYVYGHYSPAVLTFVKNQGIDMDWREEDLTVLSKGISDFLSFSYYRSGLLSAENLTENDAPNLYLDKGFQQNPLLERNEWDWAIDATGFRNIITRLYNQFGLPVFPIENGLGLREDWDGEHEIEDNQRIDYHRAHIEALKSAVIEDGADVLGYLGWGLIDIPSSSGNMDKRYGAVYVNRDNHNLRDLRRVPKKSFHWFQQVFGSNGKNM